MHPGAVILSVIGGAFALAVVALLVSKNAQTGQVFTSAGTALGSVIQAAVSPVTGGNGTGSLLSSTGLTNPLQSPV